MPNIVYDVKLDFKDVLLRPKRSTLKSRADVSGLAGQLQKSLVAGGSVPGDRVPKLQTDLQWHSHHGIQHGHRRNLRDGQDPGKGKVGKQWLAVAEIECNPVLQHGCFTCMHKFLSVEDWKKFAEEEPEAVKHVAARNDAETSMIEQHANEIVSHYPKETI